MSGIGRTFAAILLAGAVAGAAVFAHRLGTVPAPSPFAAGSLPPAPAAPFIVQAIPGTALQSAPLRLALPKRVHPAFLPLGALRAHRAVVIVRVPAPVSISPARPAAPTTGAPATPGAAPSGPSSPVPAAPAPAAPAPAAPAPAPAPVAAPAPAERTLAEAAPVSTPVPSTAPVPATPAAGQREHGHGHRDHRDHNNDSGHKDSGGSGSGGREDTSSIPAPIEIAAPAPVEAPQPPSIAPPAPDTAQPDSAQPDSAQPDSGRHDHGHHHDHGDRGSDG